MGICSSCCKKDRSETVTVCTCVSEYSVVCCQASNAERVIRLCPPPRPSFLRRSSCRKRPTCFTLTARYCDDSYQESESPENREVLEKPSDGERFCAQPPVTTCSLLDGSLTAGSASSKVNLALVANIKNVDVFPVPEISLLDSEVYGRSTEITKDFSFMVRDLCVLVSVKTPTFLFGRPLLWKEFVKRYSWFRELWLKAFQCEPEDNDKMYNKISGVPPLNFQYYTLYL